MWQIGRPHDTSLTTYLRISNPPVLAIRHFVSLPSQRCVFPPPFLRTRYLSNLISLLHPRRAEEPESPPTPQGWKRPGGRETDFASRYRHASPGHLLIASRGLSESPAIDTLTRAENSHAHLLRCMPSLRERDVQRADLVERGARHWRAIGAIEYPIARWPSACDVFEEMCSSALRLLRLG
jgi:hypothetical protein